VINLLYYTLAIGAVLSGWFVITKNNPVHSIFYLVLTFANTSLIILLTGIEYLAIILLIVYVGAIAILFIFVIKLLNIKLVELMDNSTRYLPIGFFIGFIFLIDIFTQWDNIKAGINKTYTNYSDIYNFTNTEKLGLILYTDYGIYMIIASLILLVAMIGAILLSLSLDLSLKRQDIFNQVSRYN
jgi:NADH-quinone oxidoreductase subunit J